MKVLQLIDSLNAGGAERVAVNYANSLSTRIEKSYLCATREEGLLKKNISKKVHYHYLDKKSTFDFLAIKKLNQLIKGNKIEVIHAHASSFFIATIIRILNPKTILIWHEHYGNREQSSNISKLVLKICSYFFSCIIAVNKSLKKRSKDVLLSKDVFVLANYPTIDKSLKLTSLKGDSGKRIVSLANLRPDKDHLNLLKAFDEVSKHHFDWSLHLIGKFDDDAYYNSIKEFITEHKLENNVFIYGSCADIYNILNQSAIGVLSSRSEGLPVALLEYGLAGLPVVVTNVGDCSKVISKPKEGIVVEPMNQIVLADAMKKLIANENLRVTLGQNLYKKVLSSFSEETAMNELIKIYKKY